MCRTHTGRAGDGDDATFGLSQQWQEALGDGQGTKEVDLHAAAIVGHQRQLGISKVYTHSSIIDQTPQTCHTHRHNDTVYKEENQQGVQVLPGISVLPKST